MGECYSILCKHEVSFVGVLKYVQCVLVSSQCLYVSICVRLHMLVYMPVCMSPTCDMWVSVILCKHEVSFVGVLKYVQFVLASSHCFYVAIGVYNIMCTTIS